MNTSGAIVSSVKKLRYTATITTKLLAVLLVENTCLVSFYLQRSGNSQVLNFHPFTKKEEGLIHYFQLFLTYWNHTRTSGTSYMHSQSVIRKC